MIIVFDLMMDPQIEKLLIVQHRDIALLKIKQELARLPAECKVAEAAIAEETTSMDTARQALLSKELERKELDVEVKARESALLRFRTQQAEVKKNDEYKALTHQIEQAEAEISSLEEQEIELMLEIDSVKEAFELEVVEIKGRIEAYRKEIELLDKRKTVLVDSLEEAEATVAESRADVDSVYVEQYDRVKKIVKRAPFVAKIAAQKCEGCHLRVSNEIARGVLNTSELHFCDQCARIVYS